MNMTTNILFGFIGGVAVGSVTTYGVMKKLGYVKSGDEKREAIDDAYSNAPSSDLTHTAGDIYQDRSSFDKTRKPDTHKMRYDIFGEKPDPEELAKKYKKQMAEQEHPEDDTPDEDEELDEETEFENEISESLMRHPGEVEIEEIDGFGHVLRQANTLRKNNVIYVVYQDHAGEIYPLEDLTYYSEDNVLCDVTDAPVDNIDALVGDALDDFGGYCGDDPDVVYVRNCSMGFEYEIRRVHGYYGAHIYGVSDAEMADVVRPEKRTTKGKQIDKE